MEIIGELALRFNDVIPDKTRFGACEGGWQIFMTCSQSRIMKEDKTLMSPYATNKMLEAVTETRTKTT